MATFQKPQGAVKIAIGKLENLPKDAIEAKAYLRSGDSTIYFIVDLYNNLLYNNNSIEEEKETLSDSHLKNIERDPQRNMNYKFERGLVGHWKDNEVYVIEKKDYEHSADKVQVIADDNMRMVKDGFIIGHLSESGSVSECAPRRYNQAIPSPVGKKRETGEYREEFELIAADYFNQFTTEVDSFFSLLEKNKWEKKNEW